MVVSLKVKSTATIDQALSPDFVRLTTQRLYLYYIAIKFRTKLAIQIVNEQQNVGDRQK